MAQWRSYLIDSDSNITTKCLKHVDDGIAAVFDAISNPLGDDLLQQHEE